MAPPQTLAFTANQRRILSILTRLVASSSILGSMIVLIMLLTCSRTRKPINRLIGYASVGNLFASAANLVSLSGIYQGPRSSLCIFQGFLNQIFTAADAYWALAMATNVYLTFFRNFDATRIRHMERWYLLLCYGVPVIPALCYVAYDAAHPTAPPIIGNAVIWCWVSINYDWMRLAFFYVPCWISVICTTLIYATTGRHIFKVHRQLGSMELREVNTSRMSDPSRTKKTNLHHLSRRAKANASAVTMTTDISIETTLVSPQISLNDGQVSTPKVHREPWTSSSIPPPRRSVSKRSVEVTEEARNRSSSRQSQPSNQILLHPPTASYQPYQGDVDGSWPLASDGTTLPTTITRVKASSSPVPPMVSIGGNDMCADKKTDSDVESAESTAGPVTTLTSSNTIADKIVEGSHDDVSLKALESGVDRTPGDDPSTSDTEIYSPLVTTERTSFSKPRPRSRQQSALQLRSGKISYAKVALMFFIAQCCVWIPSSVNRIYTLTHPHVPPIFSLNTTAAVVLSSQGIWNLAIFISASWHDIYSTRN